MESLGAGGGRMSLGEIFGGRNEIVALTSVLICVFFLKKKKKKKKQKKQKRKT
jgi:hypothetical protein